MVGHLCLLLKIEVHALNVQILAENCEFIYFKVFRFLVYVYFALWKNLIIKFQ